MTLREELEARKHDFITATNGVSDVVTRFADECAGRAARAEARLEQAVDFVRQVARSDRPIVSGLQGRAAALLAQLGYDPTRPAEEAEAD